MLRIKKNIEEIDLKVWTLSVAFSFLYKNTKDEKIKRKWKERFWITAQNEEQARSMFHKFLSRKIESLKREEDFKYSVHKNFKISKKKPQRNFASIYSLVAKIYEELPI